VPGRATRQAAPRSLLRGLAAQQCQTSPQGGRRRCIGRWLVFVCLLLIAAVVGGLPVYVRPQIDPLRHADAILILGGEGWDRYPFGVELAVHGWAPTVVLSWSHEPKDTWVTQQCTTPPPGLNLYCFVPDPPTTKAEGRELRRLAAKYRWRTVIVVTSRPHISRARFILERCFAGDLVMVADPVRVSALGWAFEYVYQTVGYLRAVLEPNC
jgi:hypothetical protein